VQLLKKKGGGDHSEGGGENLGARKGEEGCSLFRGVLINREKEDKNDESKKFDDA